MSPVSGLVADNSDQSRFELRVDGQLVGWSDYRPAGDSIIVAHTEIGQGCEGQGLGSVLVRGALDHIRASGKTVIPTCAFTSAYIRRHPEYVDLVVQGLRGQFDGDSLPSVPADPPAPHDVQQNQVAVDRLDRLVDDQSANSFPASDAQSFWAGR